MGGEKLRREDDMDPQLKSAFKRLKVDPQWSPDQLDGDADNLKDFWCRNSKPTSPRSVKACTKKLSTRRREPYPQDFLNSIEKLTFNSEPCQSQTCMCSDVHRISKCKKKFNYAVSSLHHRPLIREARFRIHHSEKDCKQVIRAARLKIYFQHGKLLRDKAKKTDALDHQSKSCSLSGKSDSELAIFGAKSKSDIHDFKSLNTVEKEDKADKEENKFDFKGYRSPSESCEVSKVSDSAQVASVLPRGSPSDCGVELSCSQQARLDDMSVNELAGYFDNYVHIPKKMSSMAEMMYI